MKKTDAPRPRARKTREKPEIAFDERGYLSGVLERCSSAEEGWIAQKEVVVSSPKALKEKQNGAIDRLLEKGFLEKKGKGKLQITPEGQKERIRLLPQEAKMALLQSEMEAISQEIEKYGESFEEFFEEVRLSMPVVGHSELENRIFLLEKECREIIRGTGLGESSVSLKNLIEMARGYFHGEWKKRADMIERLKNDVSERERAQSKSLNGLREEMKNLIR